MAEKTKKSRTVVIAAVAAVALLLAAMGAGWFLGANGSSGEEPTATKGSSGGSGTEGAEKTDGVCGLPVGRQKVPTTGPEATWEVRRSVTTPSSKEFGPGAVSDDGDRSCFAHNPMGAVFFALNFQGLEPEMQVRHIKEEVTEEELSGQTPQNAPTFTVRGFSVKSTSPDRAVVTLVYAVSGREGLESHTSVHEWIDGDWKAVLTAPESTTEQLNSVDSLDGYTAWGPK